MNLGSDSLGKSNHLGVSNVSRIHFGFKFIVNPDPDPIIEYAPSTQHRWRGGAKRKAFGLAISRSRVKILLEATLRNNIGQVVYTYVPLSPSSITLCRPKGGDALRLGR